MILQIICVRDRAVDAFGQPNFVLSIGGATRSFTDEVNRADTNNSMYKHPDDFELYHLGSYDDGPAAFDLLDKPRLLMVAKDVKKDK